MMTLDLDMMETRARDADRAHPEDMLAVIAALRAVLETTPEELAEAMITTDGNITAAFSYQRTAAAALAYLTRKAGMEGTNA